MVKKSVLDQFVRLRGYHIVQKRADGGWKRISLASEKTKLSRPTIYRLLKEYPNAPPKALPKYVEGFRESEGSQRIKAMYEKKIRSFKTMEKDIQEAWKLLNKKDPINWNKKDFEKVWNSEQFHDEMAGGFEEHHATHFHNLMRAIDRHDLLGQFKGKKRPAGNKKEWYLNDREIVSLIRHIETVDALLFLNLGIVKGARASSLLWSRPQNLNPKDNTMLDYEPKTKTYITRFVQPCVMKLLQKYVKDFNLQPKDLLFPHSYSYYNNELRKAGKKAGLTKTVSTQILKHTFISQAHKHGVSVETVVDQTGTEPRTIIKYYRAKDEKKIRHELLGEQHDPNSFNEWVERLELHFMERYEILRRGEEVKEP